MIHPQLFTWHYDRSQWDSRKDATTFSVAVYQWIPKASGTGLKKVNAIRVAGYVVDAQAVYAKAGELCQRLNQEQARIGELPKWVQKQYSVSRPPSAKKMTVKDRVTRMARDVWEPELKKLGFRRIGRKFWRNNAKVCHVVELNMSRWGTADESRFSTHLGVFWHEVEAVLRNPSRGKMPPPESGCTYRIDLSGLAPDGSVHNCRLDLNTDIQALGQSVLADLIKYGLPWLEFRSELRNTQDRTKYLRRTGPNEFSSKELLGGWAEVVFLVMSGKVVKAKAMLESWLYGSPSDAGVLALAERLDIDLSGAGSEWARK